MNRWLFLDSYIEITFCHKEKKCLLYNTLDSKKYIFRNKEYEIIKKIYYREYSIKYFENNENKRFSDLIENNFLGGIIESKEKPFIFYPLINIQRNLKKFKKLSYRNEGANILENLFELIIFINGKKRTLLHEILNLIRAAEYSSITKVNLIIENYFFLKTEINELILTINNKLHCLMVIKIKYDEYTDLISESTLKGIKNYSIIVIIENDNFNADIFNEKNIRFVFKIYNKIDYNHFVSNLQNKKIEYDFELDIANCNIDFLKENVFLNKADILKMKVTKQDYDANKTLNKYFFGKLVIKNNKIYNRETKGKLITKLDENKELKEIVFDALINSNKWFLIRDRVKPCKTCVFKYICPPISDYEIKASRYNFCNIIN